MHIDILVARQKEEETAWNSLEEGPPSVEETMKIAYAERKMQDAWAIHGFPEKRPTPRVTEKQVNMFGENFEDLYKYIDYVVEPITSIDELEMLRDFDHAPEKFEKAMNAKELDVYEAVNHMIYGEPETKEERDAANRKLDAQWSMLYLKRRQRRREKQEAYKLRQKKMAKDVLGRVEFEGRFLRKDEVGHARSGLAIHLRDDKSGTKRFTLIPLSEQTDAETRRNKPVWTIKERLREYRREFDSLEFFYMGKGRPRVRSAEHRQAIEEQLDDQWASWLLNLAEEEYMLGCQEDDEFWYALYHEADFDVDDGDDIDADYLAERDRMQEMEMDFRFIQ